ncbi:hypothetical protein ACB098_02G188200 [Castanea mollissima]
MQITQVQIQPKHSNYIKLQIQRPPSPPFFFFYSPLLIFPLRQGKKLCCNKQLHPYGLKNNNKYTTIVAYLPKYKHYKELCFHFHRNIKEFSRINVQSTDAARRLK